MKRSSRQKLSAESKHKAGKAISKKYTGLSGNNFLNAHWEIAHALLNNTINPSTANAFATQTSRILGFKKLEIDKARLVGEKMSGKLLGGNGK